MKNNTDYVNATIREKGLGIDMITPHQNLEFYVAEPIGGGGGTALVSMGVDTKEDYVEFVEKIKVIGVSHWQEVLERGQVQTRDIPAFWSSTPVWGSVIDN